MNDEPQEITDPLPPPGAATTGEGEEQGWVGSLAARASQKYEEVSTKIAESEKFQEAKKKVEGFTAEKKEAAETWYAEKMENDEKFRERVEKAKELGDKTVEKVGEYKEKVGEKVGEYKEKAGEYKGHLERKTTEVLEKVGEKSAATKAKAADVWVKGKGKIVKIKNKAQDEWGMSTQEILLKRAESAEKWKSLKIRGAEEIQVPARNEYTTAYFIEKGTLMSWTFRVKDFDVGFGVRMRVMQDGGSREDDILPVERYDLQDTIEGSWLADEDRTMVLVFDNSYSKLRGKTVAYMVGTERPVASAAPSPEEGTTETSAGGEAAGEGTVPLAVDPAAEHPDGAPAQPSPTNDDYA